MLEMSEPDFEQLFLDHLPLIERAIRFQARRYRLKPVDEEDFYSSVMVKLVDKNYAVLRKCLDLDDPKPFFSVVVANCCKDFLIQKDGKKRPGSRPRIWVGEETLQHLETKDPSPLKRLLQWEERRRSKKVFARLAEELAKLPDEDRMILRSHFEKGWKWKTVADNLRLDPTALYPRKDTILKRLEERAGISAEAMREALQSAGLEFWAKSPGKLSQSPSKKRN